MNLVLPNIKIVSSSNAYKIVGYQERGIYRSFWKRWFSFPWHPFRYWDKTMEPITEPFAFLVGNTIVCHPSIEAQIRQTARLL